MLAGGPRRTPANLIGWQVSRRTLARCAALCKQLSYHLDPAAMASPTNHLQTGLAPAAWGSITCLQPLHRLNSPSHSSRRPQPPHTRAQQPNACSPSIASLAHSRTRASLLPRADVSCSAMPAPRGEGGWAWLHLSNCARVHWHAFPQGLPCTGGATQHKQSWQAPSAAQKKVQRPPASSSTARSRSPSCPSKRLALVSTPMQVPHMS